MTDHGMMDYHDEDGKVTTTQPFTCRLCGAGPMQCKGFLARVNQKGVAGIYECRPLCGADLPPSERLLAAIDGETK